MTITLNGTTGITLPNGSASAPAATGSDTDTGIVYGTNTVQVSTGGTTAVTVDSSQNVGIGTSSPAQKLHVVQATDANTDGIRIARSGNSAQYGSFSNYGGATWITAVDTAGLGNNITVFNRSANGSTFTESMRITSGGDVSLGGSPAAPPTVSNDIFAGGLYLNPNRRTTGSGANTFFDSSSGAFFRSTSSIKYKTDVNDATYGLADVLSLRPVTYKGKSDADTNKVFGGFIAEEVDALGLKEFVEYDSEGNPDSLAYGNMVSLLTKAIQELKAELDTVKTELATLKGTA